MNFLKVESLHLKNVRCYDDQKFEFSPSKNVLVGTNGAGKSTVINSIGIALFGNDYLVGTPLKMSDLIKWGTDEATISLEFSTSKGKYKSVFKFSGNKNKWTLYDLNKGKPRQITTKIKETKSKIIELFDEVLDEASFKNAVCSPQGMIASLLDQTNSKRMEQIYKILGVDMYKKISENTNRLLRELRGRKERAHDALKIRQENLLDIESIAQALEMLENRLRGICNELPELETNSKSMDEQIQSLEKTKQEYHLILNTIRQLNEDIKGLESKIAANTKKLETEKSKAKIDVNGLDDLRKMEAEVKAGLDSIRKEKEKKQSEKTQFLRSKKDLDELSRETEDDRKRYEYERKKLEALKRDNEIESTAQLKGLIGQIENELALHSEKIGSKSKEIKGKQETLNELGKQVNEIEAEISEFSTKFKELFNTDSSKMGAVKEELDKELKDIENRLNNLANLIKETASDLGQVEGQRSQKEKIIGLLKESRQAGHDRAKCPTCRQSLKDVNFDELIDLHQNEIQNLIANAEKLAKDQKKAEEEEKQLKKQHSSLQKRRNALETFEKQSLRISEKKKQLETLKDQYSEREKELQNLKNQLAELQKRDVSQQEKKLKDLKGVLSSIEKIEGDLRSLEGKINGQEKRIKDLKNEIGQVNIQELEKDLQKISETIEAKERLMESLNDLRLLFSSIENDQSELKKKKASLQENQKKLESFSPETFSDEKLTHLKEEFSKIQEKLGGLKGEKQRLEKEQIPEKREELERAKEQQKEISNLQNQISQLNTAIEKLELVHRVVQEVPLTVLRQITTSVSNMTTRLVQRFLPDYGFQQIRLSPDGDLTIVRNGNQISLNSLSGGEKTVLALALRTALAQKVVPINFMILDEPTQHLDRVRVEEFIEVMDRGNVFGNAHGQLILVTHVEEFKRVADKALEIDATDRRKRTVKVVN